MRPIIERYLKFLASGLSSGRVSGTVDNVNYENVDFGSLENSILEATKIGCKAKSTIQLLENCEMIL